MKQWKEKLNEVLSNLAVNIPTVTGCFGVWGEVELPECIREEVEEKKKNR